MTGWWRASDRKVTRLERELREARASIGRLNALQAEAIRQVDTVEAARDQARAQLVVIERAGNQHAAKLRRIADVLADQSLSTVDCPVCTRARQVLTEGPGAGPVSGGGQQ